MPLSRIVAITRSTIRNEMMHYPVSPIEETDWLLFPGRSCWSAHVR